MRAAAWPDAGSRPAGAHATRRVPRTDTPGRPQGARRRARPDRCPIARRRPQRGAALLLAMLVVALVATMASAMVLHQQRAIELEAAERARSQAGWVLDGALDWARLILREDARSGGADHAGEPWAVPLAEARLSTFLAADSQHNTEVTFDAFLSGAITDAQSRFNLLRLVADDGKPIDLEVVGLRRLCQSIGLPGELADRIARSLGEAVAGADADTPLRPARVSQLVWLGIDAATLARLEDYVTLLPVRTPVNANTAPREVLLAAIDGIDLGVAERIVQSRQRSPLLTIDKLREQLPPALPIDEARVGVATRFFEVRGRMRLDDRVLEERSLVERRPGAGGEVIVRRRERHSLAMAPA